MIEHVVEQQSHPRPHRQNRPADPTDFQGIEQPAPSLGHDDPSLEQDAAHLVCLEPYAGDSGRARDAELDIELSLGLARRTASSAG